MKNPTRRNFLRGTGGLLVALPFLEGLAGRASAQAAPRKRFVSIQIPHGGAWGADMHPAQGSLTESLSYAGYTVRSGALSVAVSGGKASLSPILTADSGTFTSALAGKMNVIRGLGLPFEGFHHLGGHLGNWATTDANPNGLSNMPTIDNLMAYAPGFYDAAPLVRVMLCGIDNPTTTAASWTYENPTTKTGPVVRGAPAGNSRRLFDRVYVPTSGPTTPAPMPRRSIVDRILSDYQRLRADSRLSTRDRQRLDAHISHLDELETKLTRPPVMCGAADPVPNNDEVRFVDHYADSALAVERMQLWMDVIAIAFACDTSRIATLPLTSSFSDWDGTGARDFHQAIAHQAGSRPDATLAIAVDAPHPRFRMAETYQRVFEHGFLYLARKLDEISEGESTVLDNTLIAWSHEAGIQTHDQIDMPVITAGGAGGAIRTGMHIDYRNMAYRWPQQDVVPPEQVYPGLHWHQWLGTVMQAMGVPASEYSTGTYGGYGDEFVDPDATAKNLYPEATFRARSEMLPFLGA